jgi:PTS system nitrogen regulatory IIA component
MRSNSESRGCLAGAPAAPKDDPFLARWLQPGRILCDVAAGGTDDLFVLAATQVAQSHGLDPGPVRRALARREQAETTALGGGFAIPHARIAGIAEPLTLLIRLRDGLDFKAPDGAPVALFFVILVPLDDPHAHLRLLAIVAEMFSDSAFRQRLDDAADASAMADVLNAGVAAIRA